jgi:hypothetical protein
LNSKLNEYATSRSLLTIESFAKLPDKRKLAFFKKHRRIRYAGICDCGCGERYGSEQKLFDLKTGDDYVDKLKEILDGCEHVV